MFIMTSFLALFYERFENCKSILLLISWLDWSNLLEYVHKYSPIFTTVMPTADHFRTLIGVLKIHYTNMFHLETGNLPAACIAV